MTCGEDTTSSALRRLSRPEPSTPFTLNRRRFLQSIAAFGAGAVASAGLPGLAAQAFAGTPIGPHDGVLVLLTLAGGNDSLNMVVPYGDGAYYQKRPTVALPAAQVLHIDGRVGLHPQLPYLKRLFDAGQVGIVRGVGAAGSDLSHFVSMAESMRGWAGPAATAPQTGWLGRYLDGLAAAADPLDAVHLGSSVPLHLLGAARQGSALATRAPVGSSVDAWDVRVFDTVRRFAPDPFELGRPGYRIAQTQRDMLALATAVAPVYATALPQTRVVDQMTLAARLINANLGLRVVSLLWGDFDSHDGELTVHGDRMAELDAGIAAFYAELAPVYASRVTLMTVSEFGRRVGTNDNGGTDHGTAGDQLLIGPQIRGGLHGVAPSLTKLDSRGNLIPQVDFRSVYATVLARWLGGDPTSILGADPAQLDLFRAGPGAAVPTPSAGATRAGQLVAVAPNRRLDTREGGTAGAGTPIGADKQVDVMVAGTGDVPISGVTAVVLNVTVTQPSAAGYLTVWPTGEARPVVSSLNFASGDTVPNLVVVKVGARGMVSVYNSQGSSQVVVDVAGYVSEGGDSAITPVVPQRLLDTRKTGLALGSGGERQLAVTGGPVPAGARAVLLNVTATQPSTDGYLTVYPSATARPLASNLNFRSGQTVPNLVLAKVATTGNVTLYNAAGSVHVIVDLLGFVGPTLAPGNLVTISPDRALDTRQAGGAFKAGETRLLRVGGRFGVPANGLIGLVVNVTVTQPSTAGYLTVFPAGMARPDTSNVNFVAGQTVPNLVMTGCNATGDLAIYNASGQAHVVVDVAGYVVA